MKNSVIAAILVLACSAVSAAVIAEWDFTKSMTSADGKYTFKPRVAALVKTTAEGVEFSFPAKPDTDAGATLEKTYKEMTPQGAFELEITFKPDFNEYAPKGKTKYSVLLDNKYYYYHKSNKPAFHSGLLVRANLAGSTVSATVYLGLGDRTVTVTSNWVKKVENKFYTLKMKYDPAAGTAAFSWDGGKPTIRKIAKAANLAPAGRALVIGDRYSSTRMPFKGIISKIVLSSVEAPASAPAPAEKK